MNFLEKCLEDGFDFALFLAYFVKLFDEVSLDFCLLPSLLVLSISEVTKELSSFSFVFNALSD